VPRSDVFKRHFADEPESMQLQAGIVIARTDEPELLSIGHPPLGVAGDRNRSFSPVVLLRNELFASLAASRIFTNRRALASSPGR
jgi:hypothetical protein